MMPIDLLSEIPNYPGILAPGNLDLDNRPAVPNPEGGTSTVYSMSIGLDNGKVALVPRVVGGKILSPEDAIEHFKQTKEHLGIFGSEDAANAYDKQMHEQMGWTGPNNQWPEANPIDPNTYEYTIKK